MTAQSWIGKTIGGRYQIESLLGQGGMSVVYRAYDPNLHRPVAIKMIHSHLSNNINFISRFKEEATAIARLRHPNIVQVYDFNVEGETYYMIMEYLVGETLQARLKRINTSYRKMPLDEVLNICIQLCEAASSAHIHEMVHRDIKPANIMLNVNNQAILMDFGIVKIIGGDYHTATGATIGTAMYMSPEQIRSERVDDRTDIYSLGVTLYEMLAGKPPYTADSAMTLMMMVLNDPLPDMREVRQDISESLVKVLEKALAKEPIERFQSMEEMASALRSVQAELANTSSEIPATIVESSESDPITTPSNVTDSPDEEVNAEVLQIDQVDEVTVATDDNLSEIMHQTVSNTPFANKTPAHHGQNNNPASISELRINPIKYIIYALGAVCILLAFAYGAYASINSEKSPLRQVFSQVTAQKTQVVNSDELSITQSVEETILGPDISKQSVSDPPNDPMKVNSFQDVKKAVVKIEAQGTFIDPQIGAIVNKAGYGSGFIIDPAGIAVTNNHVVTGAAILNVWVDGESIPRNAKILGVSECSDLALIDIDGDGYHYLDWHPDSIDVGMDIYVAGYPYGDREYALTKGFISKAKVSGETNWASVESMVEYEVTNNPGISGGPVVSEDGKVLAVHYTGDESTRQAFGISKDVANNIIVELHDGNYHDSIGVNGQAVNTEDGSLSGVWVSSVLSGSPVDQSGVKAGDIITKLEDLVLANDGTLTSYCDILRSHNLEDTLSIQVSRWASGEILQGQLNGRNLQVTTNLTTPDSNKNPNDQDSTNNESVNPNASQSGEYYYYTDFDGYLDSWIYLLTQGDENNIWIDAENSRMRVEINATETIVYFVYDDHDYSNVRIETRVENLGNKNNVSLVCRGSEQGWYEFNIADDGIYRILWHNDAIGSGYVQIAEGSSALINMGADINEYAAVCQGNQLTLYINGVEVKSVTDENLINGKVGVSVASLNTSPVIIEFDYFAAIVP